MTRILNVLVAIVCASLLVACGNNNPVDLGPTPLPVPPLPPIVVDVCTNLDGVQETVPDGYEDLDQDGVCTEIVVPPPKPILVSLSGTVRSNNGSLLNGATVRILDGVNAGRTATTNASGVYRFDSLTAGNGNLSAKAVGYNEASAGVYINSENTLDFVLKPEVIDPNGSWVGSGTGTASDGTPVSVTIELTVSGREVEKWVVKYNFSAKCISVFTSSFKIPIVGNLFSRTRGQDNVFLYTPTVFGGTFSSSTTVAGTITLVKSLNLVPCPASATIEWSGTKK